MPLRNKSEVKKDNRQSFPDRGGYFFAFLLISYTRPINAIKNKPICISSLCVMYIGINPLSQGEPFPPKTSISHSFILRNYAHFTIFWHICAIMFVHFSAIAYLRNYATMISDQTKRNRNGGKGGKTNGKLL